MDGFLVFWNPNILLKVHSPVQNVWVYAFLNIKYVHLFSKYALNWSEVSVKILT